MNRRTDAEKERGNREGRSGGRKGVTTTPRRRAAASCRQTHPAVATSAEEEG
ncbi:uncharacterized protein DS421_4g126160 [Arachis hypogaea]|nr:uncharacterized protein DS421_4g126160 [Arachis hypogaea]